MRILLNFFRSASPIILALALPSVVFAGDGSKFMGVASCSSSNCHGSQAPRNSTNVLQNEYVTWSKHDKHAQAWLVLANDRSKKIAEHLGLGDPQKEPLCLDCHATYVADRKHQGEKYTVEDGVSCESCHGASERWLSGHENKGSTHAGNLKEGLSDIVNPDKRAKLCTTCHVGTADKNLPHRIMGAGHPRLSFELDTFGALMPWHWEIDQDYTERKSDYSAVKFWLAGQVEIAKRNTELMLSPKFASDGMWPEFALYNCSSCHHGLGENRWKEGNYEGRPGEPRPNIASALLLSQVLMPFDETLAKSLQEKLHALLSKSKSGNAADDIGAIKTMLEGAVKSRVLNLKVGAGETNELLHSLVRFGLSDRHFAYEEAEQIAMGISAVLAERSPDQNQYKSEVEAMYKALASFDSYSLGDFRGALGGIGK